MITIIVDDQLPKLECLQALGQVKPVASAAITKETIADADALIMRTVTPVNEALLSGTNIRFVGSASAGYDHMDTQYLDAERIHWSYAPGCNAEAVAEYVISAISLAIEQQRLPSKPTVGIVGVGHVGSKVKYWCEQLHWPYLLNDPPRAAQEPNFPHHDLISLQACDVVTLHTPLVTQGKHATVDLINEAWLHSSCGKMLINTARGEVVNEQALLNTHKTLALDVWQNEPRINTALVEKAWIATPHIAGYSAAAKARAIYQLATELAKHIHAPIPSALHDDSICHYTSINDWRQSLLANTHLLSSSHALKHQPTAFKTLRQAYPLRNEHYLDSSTSS